LRPLSRPPADFFFFINAPARNGRASRIFHPRKKEQYEYSFEKKKSFPEEIFGVENCTTDLAESVTNKSF